MPKLLDEKCDRLDALSKENDELLTVQEGEEPKVLSDEDRTRSDALEKEMEELSEEIKDLTADEERRKRQEARRQGLSTTSRGRQTTPDDPPPAETLDGDRRSAAQIRAYTGSLRSFQGPNAREDAYWSGQFLLSILGDRDSPVTKRAHQRCTDHGIQFLAMQEDSNQAGGFLVFPEFDAAIISLREEYGVFRRECKVVPMASDTKTVPRRSSGLTAYFIDENEAPTESEKKWNQVRLVARKIGILTKWSTELDEDSVISMADDLADEVAYALALKEDNCGFLGTGTSTYGGISGLITETTTATATTVTAAAGNTAFSTLDLDDFESCIGKLPQYAEANAKWFISKAGWAASMLRLIDAAGGNTGAMIAGMAPKEFLGYPVVISQVMNSTLTAQTTTYGLAYLGNLRLAATMGTRRGVTIKLSDQRYFELDQLAILATERFALNVHDVGDTSSAGPIIMLRTPGA